MQIISFSALWGGGDRVTILKLALLQICVYLPAFACSIFFNALYAALHSTVYALLPACYVQTLQAAAPIFAKSGSAFSGFYRPGAIKLYLLNLPRLSANCRLNRQIKLHRLRQLKIYHPEKSKVGHFALFFSFA